MLSSALCVTRSAFTFGDGLERLRVRSAGVSSIPRRYVVIKFSRCAGGARRSKELEDLKILRSRTSTGRSKKKTESSESGEVSVVEEPKSTRRTVGNTSRPYIVPPRRVRSKEMVLKLAKGFRGNKNIRIARGRVRKALEYAYRDRRTRKRDFRRLWITRINAAARLHGLSYDEFIHGLNLQKVEVNRKALAQIAVLDSEGFKKVAELTKQFKEGLKVETSNTL